MAGISPSRRGTLISCFRQIAFIFRSRPDLSWKKQSVSLNPAEQRFIFCLPYTGDSGRMSHTISTLCAASCAGWCAANLRRRWIEKRTSRSLRRVGLYGSDFVQIPSVLVRAHCTNCSYSGEDAGDACFTMRDSKLRNAFRRACTTLVTCSCQA